MPLDFRKINSIFEKEINSYLNNELHSNLYFFSRNVTGAGKSTLLRQIGEYCVSAKIPFVSLKNLCSLKEGFKIVNTFTENLNQVIRKIPSSFQVFLCDEVKDPRFYNHFKYLNPFFVSVGYSPEKDIENLEGWKRFGLDGALSQKERYDILLSKFPSNKLLVDLVSSKVPNIGRGELCLKEFFGRSVKGEEIESFSESSKTKGFWEKKNLDHYLIVDLNNFGDIEQVIKRKI